MGLKRVIFRMIKNSHYLGSEWAAESHLLLSERHDAFMSANLNEPIDCPAYICAYEWPRNPSTGESKAETGAGPAVVKDERPTDLD